MHRTAPIAAALLAATLPWATPCLAHGTPEDEQAIRNVIVEMTEGFNKHDARASTRMYTPDADLITVRGERFRGTTEFEKGLASIFTTRAREATHRTLNVSVRFLRPDVALAHVTNELSGLIAPDGGRPPPHQELSLRVFVKEGGEWRVAAFHNTLVQPFGAPAPKPQP
ncbi:MAG: SgcJ/EcaC family oxidoreductase [Burkholderiaceae bacterium]|nr:SgcJ/EcaC family oxidoreductase [Burkholderiaceae bacterium]